MVKCASNFEWQCEEEERRQRVMVITEFAAGDPEATMHSPLPMRSLKYRRAVRLLAKSIKAQTSSHAISISGLIGAVSRSTSRDRASALTMPSLNRSMANSERNV